MKEKRSWTNEDRRNYGFILNELRRLDALVPRDQVEKRLHPVGIPQDVVDAAIKKWRREILEYSRRA